MNESERDARTPDGTTSDLEDSILNALRDAWKSCPVFSVHGSGVRWRQAPWTPSRWDWSLVLTAYLPYYLRKFHVRPREEGVLGSDVRGKPKVLSFDEPLGEADDGSIFTLHDVVGREDGDDSGAATDYRPRRPAPAFRQRSSGPLGPGGLSAADMLKIRKQIPGSTVPDAVGYAIPDLGHKEGHEWRTKKRSRGSFVSSGNSTGSSTPSRSTIPAMRK